MTGTVNPGKTNCYTKKIEVHTRTLLDDAFILYTVDLTFAKQKLVTNQKRGTER
jgi:hypothetical protein